jgi:hypothetical protein
MTKSEQKELGVQLEASVGMPLRDLRTTRNDDGTVTVHVELSSPVEMNVDREPDADGLIRVPLVLPNGAIGTLTLTPL